MIAKNKKTIFILGAIGAVVLVGALIYSQFQREDLTQDIAIGQKIEQKAEILIYTRKEVGVGRDQYGNQLTKNKILMAQSDSWNEQVLVETEEGQWGTPHYEIGADLIVLHRVPSREGFKIFDLSSTQFTEEFDWIFQPETEDFLPESPTPHWARSLFSPDRSKTAYATLLETQWERDESNFAYILDIEEKVVKKVSHSSFPKGPSAFGPIHWSEDETKVYFSLRNWESPIGRGNKLWEIDIKSGNTREIFLSPQTAFFKFLNTGQLIVLESAFQQIPNDLEGGGFVTQFIPPLKVWIVDIKEDSKEALAQFESMTVPAYMPVGLDIRGKRIAYLFLNSNGQRELWYTDIDQKTNTRLPTISGVEELNLSSGGRYLAVEAQNGEEIFVIDLYLGEVVHSIKAGQEQRKLKVRTPGSTILVDLVHF